MEVEVGTAFEKADVYTGKADVQIICVNPTLEEIVKYELPTKKDVAPVYIGKTDTGIDKLILRVWVKLDNPKIVTNITFFLEAQDKVASTGSIQYINDYGQNSFGQSLDEVLNRIGKNGQAFFKNEGCRVARVGEAELIEFIRKWLCVANDQKSVFKNFSKIVSGDVSEITDLVKNYGTSRKVQVLLGEKSGYQNVYSRYFERAGGSSNTYWEKHFNNSQTTFNYQGSFKLQKWSGVEPDKEDSSDIKQFDMFS